jgi:hypothetical protein
MGAPISGFLGGNPEAVSALDQLAQGNTYLDKGMSGGASLAGQFYGQNSLGRLNDQSNTLSPQMTSLQGALMDRVGYKQPTQNTQALNMLGATAGAYGPSATTTNALNRMGQSLGGYSQDTLNAMTETQQAGLDQALNQAMAGVNRGALRGGVQGGAAGYAASPFVSQYLGGYRQTARDVAMANEQEKQRALGQYADYSRGLDTDVFGRRLGGQQAYNQAVQGQQGLNETSANNRLNMATTLQGGLDQNQLDRQIFNLNQLGKEKAGQLGLIFGGAQMGAAQQAADRGYDLSTQALEVARINANKDSPRSNPFTISFGGDASSGNWGAPV